MSVIDFKNGNRGGNVPLVIVIDDDENISGQNRDIKSRRTCRKL